MHQRHDFRNHFILNTLSIGLLFVGVTAQPAMVMLDGNPETPGISPVPRSVIAGEKLLVGISVERAVNVHSYSVKISYDPAIVTFEGAAAKLSPLTPAFLETGGGKIAAFLAVPGKESVEIAATLTGKNSSVCASGNGILGYLSFSAKTGGDPRIVVTEARLVDPDAKNTFAEIP